MKAGALIVCLSVAALISVRSFAASPTQAPSKKAPPGPRTELFVGKGTASWLPKVTLFPTGAEIETQAKKLSSRERNMDPFGLPTFPRQDDVLPTVAQVNRTAEKVTLNQALQSLKVTGINLQKKEILLHGRNVFQGDVMVLSYKNEVFLAEVTEINATQILFRDVKRHETGVLPHKIVPHLELEPVQNHAGLNGEGKVTPMENPKPLQQ